jgi:hypothetical protein
MFAPYTECFKCALHNAQQNSMCIGRSFVTEKTWPHTGKAFIWIYISSASRSMDFALLVLFERNIINSYQHLPVPGTLAVEKNFCSRMK